MLPEMEVAHMVGPIFFNIILRKKEILPMYRHSSIYAVNVGTQNKNRINRGYIAVLNGRKIG